MKFLNKMYLLAPICAAMLLASCGGEKAPDENKPNVDPDKPEVDPNTPENPDEGLVVNPNPVMKNKVSITLKTTAGGQSRPILERMKKYFYYEEPNIEVKIEYPGGGYPGISKQTLEEFQSNKHGDLVMIYPDVIATCIEKGYAYDLEPYMYNSEYGIGDEIEDYIPKYIEEGANYTKPGTYSLPFSKSTEVIYYDSEKFIGKKFEGINNGDALTPDYFNTLTWDKLFNEFCPKIIDYAKKPENKGFLSMPEDKPWGVVGYDSDANLFITLAEQYGYPYTHVDKVAGKGYVDFYKKDGSENRMLDKMVEFANYSKKNYIVTQNTINDRPNNIFKTNNLLLSVGSTAGMSYQYDGTNPKKLAVARIPQASNEEGQVKVISQGPSMAFLQHKNAKGEWDEDRKLASWLFYKFMTTSANAADWAINAKYMPIRSSIFNTNAYKMASDPSKVKNQKSEKALLARINQIVPSFEGKYFVSPAFPGSSTCRDEVDAMVGKILKLNPLNEDKTPRAITAADVKPLFDETLKKINLN